MLAFDPDIPFVPSPNFSSRKGHKPIGCVIHYTGGGSASGSMSWLCNPQSKASSHFIISRGGRTTQLVALDHAAWHAGVSEMLIDGEMEGNANLFTIGIELANHGFVQKIGDEFYYSLGRTLKKYRREPPEQGTLIYDNSSEISGWWEPYPDPQMDALQDLLRRLTRAWHADAASNLIGHEEIGMPLGRKKDPGPLFPWDRFSRQTERRTWTVKEK